MVNFDINRCVSCGECSRVCSGFAIKMQSNSPVFSPEKCFNCGHCESTCPTSAVKFENDFFQIEAKTSLENSVINRRSIRHFKAETPPKAVIERAINLTQWAPSSKNQRSMAWCVVHGREKVREALSFAMQWSRENDKNTALVNFYDKGFNLITCDAPCLIFACIPEDAINAEVDCGLTMGTLELLLFESGLGSCWGGFCTRLFSCDQSLKDHIGVPEGMKICSTLMLGFADEKYNKPPSRPAPNVIWRT